MKVRVKNFQSIADAEIDIDGFTVITGSNNSGKTALIRALRGAFQNTSGNTFVRHGTDACRVEVDLGDAEFSWEKGHKIKPTYEIGSKKLHPGREIPKEVTDLGVRSIMAGGREIYPQIANQFSGQVFLVDQPGSVLAEAVADVERVGKLNRALKASEKDRRSASSELKVRNKDLKTYQADLELFDGVDDVEDTVGACEQHLTQTKKIGGWVDGLTALRERYNTAQNVVQSLADVRTGFEDFVGTEQTVPQLEALRSEIKELRSLQSRWSKTKQELLSTQQALEAVAEVKLPQTIGLNKIVRALASLNKLRTQQESVAQQTKDLTSDLRSAQTELDNLEKEIKDTLGEIGQCPVCGAEHYDASTEKSVLSAGGLL